MKKLICLLMTVALFVPTVVMADAMFSDLPKNHWAYSYVNELVNDKTVNGFPDGTFRPDEKVTRAEFVKMIGKTANKAAQDYVDVPKTHWGYDYIMYSGVVMPNNIFYPDTPMTRNDVGNLVWERAGAVKGLKAAPNVTDGFTKKDAAAWLYNFGIMNGDDGINLRPDDGITRAEAAAIICRSRTVKPGSPKVNFVDKVSDKTLEAVFNGSHLFDKKYLADAKITNGELARAGIRFIFDEATPSFRHYVTKTLFESDYAREMYVMGSKVLGDEYITLDFTNKNALVKDAVAYLAFCCSQKTLKTINYGPKDKYYPEITDKKLTENANKALTFAYDCCFTIYSDGRIGAYGEITHKEMAALLIQLDNVVGINNKIYVSDNASTKVHSNIRTDVVSYPKNKAAYGIIDNDIPNKVYEAPFVNASKNPIDTYDFTMNYSRIFSDYARNLCITAKVKTNSSVAITFSPAMIYKAENGYTIRAKIEVLDSINGVKLNNIIPPADGVNADILLKAGEYVYCDINTGVEVTDIVIPTSSTKITQVIR